GDHDYMLGQFGADGVTYFADYPLALRIVWTINILGGLVAPVLLVMRNRWALAVSVTASLAQILLLAITFSALDRWAMLGSATSWFDIGVGVVTILFAAYCWVARQRRFSSAPSPTRTGSA